MVTSGLNIIMDVDTEMEISYQEKRKLFSLEKCI